MLFPHLTSFFDQQEIMGWTSTKANNICQMHKIWSYFATLLTSNKFNFTQSFQKTNVLCCRTKAKTSERKIGRAAQRKKEVKERERNLRTASKSHKNTNVYLYLFVVLYSAHFSEFPSWNCSLIRIYSSVPLCVFALACLFAISCSRYYIYLNKSKIAYCEMRSNKMVKRNAKFVVFKNTFISIIWMYVFVYVFSSRSNKMSVSSEECKLKCFPNAKTFIHSLTHLFVRLLVHSVIRSVCAERNKRTRKKNSSEKFQAEKTRSKKIFLFFSIKQRDEGFVKFLIFFALFFSTFLHAYLVKW